MKNARLHGSIAGIIQLTTAAFEQDPAERRRAKIRRELALRYFDDERMSSATLAAKFRKILNRG